MRESYKDLTTCFLEFPGHGAGRSPSRTLRTSWVEEMELRVHRQGTGEERAVWRLICRDLQTPWVRSRPCWWMWGNWGRSHPGGREQRVLALTLGRKLCLFPPLGLENLISVTHGELDLTLRRVLRQWGLVSPQLNSALDQSEKA